MTLRLESRLLPLALLAASACAGAGAASRPAPAAEAAREAAPQARAAAPATSAPAAKAAADEIAGPSPRAQRLFDEAVSSLEDQKKLKVPTDWELLERKWRAVTDAGAIPEAWFNLGVVLERLGRIPEARAAYDQALSLRPGFREPAVNKAILDEADDDPRRAAADYAALARKYPDDAAVRVRLAILYRQAGQLDEAWRLAREALMREPRAVGAYKVMMRIALERGNPDLAELIALRAQKLDASDPELTYFVGEILAKRGDETAAAAQYRKALAQGPAFLPARYELLRLALKAQNWEGVVEQGKAALVVEPNDPRVHLAMGVAERYLGKADAALASYDRAQSLSGGKLPEVHLDRGLLLMKVKNECEPAIAEFRSYQSQAPSAAASGPVYALQKECEQILVANKQAAEAARQMQQEADRKAADSAHKAAPAPKPAPAPGPAPAQGEPR
jgi:tetratricopeptide (TPR) repeat protein